MLSNQGVEKSHVTAVALLHDMLSNQGVEKSHVTAVAPLHDTTVQLLDRVDLCVRSIIE